MYYYSFNEYLQDKFHTKVRKIGLNAGFSCPNKDGDSGRDGCIYCNESGFSDFIEEKMSIREQIEFSIRSMRKRNAQKFIAYFQNATNTNAEPEELKRIYDIIREYPEMVGICIGTRPDCIDADKLDLIASYTDNYDVWVEYGVQTVHDKTLKYINRGHTFSESAKAIEETAKRGINVAVHIILGLPGESEDDMMRTAKIISGLPVSGVKLHMIHVLKDTKLEELYKEGKMKLLSQAEYVGLVCDFLEHLKVDCVVLRLISDARKSFLVAPKWVNAKSIVRNQIESEFKRRGTKQGYLVHSR